MNTTAPVVQAPGSTSNGLHRWLGAGTWLVVGCGGGTPLLHPAQVLPEGTVRASAGFSGQVAIGGLDEALRNAVRELSATRGNGPTPPAGDTMARGAMVVASVAPGLAPWVGARVGLGHDFEAGLAYTGRAARLDVRRAFEVTPHFALSIGAAGSAVLYGHQSGEALPEVDVGRLHGWGADLPVLIGYSSDGDLYALWVGARGGWEHVDISRLSTTPSPPAFGPGPLSLSATRYWAGGLLGIAIGFRHLHVAMELDASFATITGDYNARHTSLSGLTLAPAASAWWKF